MPKDDCDAIMFDTFLEPMYRGNYNGITIRTFLIKKSYFVFTTNINGRSSTFYETKKNKNKKRSIRLIFENRT